jgi:hypothetical protein
MSIVPYILGGLYGIYCTTFCCNLGYTIYIENKENKEKRKTRIKLEYRKLQMNHIQEDIHNIHPDIYTSNIRNVKLTTLSTINEEEENITFDEEKERLFD